MTTIDNLFNYTLFTNHVKDGLVRMREHPEYSDLVIANYTQRAQFGNHWDEVTTQCRGLVFNRDSGEVLARPWRKFFNYNQVEAPDLSTFTSVEVTDKVDGSLIIAYPHPETGELRATTKGSFDSEMVAVANELFDTYGLSFDPEWTPLFEVVYPGNRVVVDYHGERELYALGAVNIATGDAVGNTHALFDGWQGKRARTFHVDSVDAALQLPPRENAEGIVIRDTLNGNMVKMKQEDYVSLHRAFTNFTTLNIWEHLRDGTVEAMIDLTPDELYGELHRHLDRFNEMHEKMKNDIVQQRDEIVSELGIDPGSLDADSRRAYALRIKDLPASDKGFLFTALFSEDGLDKKIWQVLKPGVDDREFLGSFNRTSARIE